MFQHLYRPIRDAQQKRLTAPSSAPRGMEDHERAGWHEDSDQAAT